MLHLCYSKTAQAFNTTEAQNHQTLTEPICTTYQTLSRTVAKWPAYTRKSYRPPIIWDINASDLLLKVQESIRIYIYKWYWVHMEHCQILQLKIMADNELRLSVIKVSPRKEIYKQCTMSYTPKNFSKVSISSIMSHQLIKPLQTTKSSAESTTP